MPQSFVDSRLSAHFSCEGKWYYFCLRCGRIKQIMMSNSRGCFLFLSYFIRRHYEGDLICLTSPISVGSRDLCWDLLGYRICRFQSKSTVHRSQYVNYDLIFWSISAVLSTDQSSIITRKVIWPDLVWSRVMTI